MAVGILLVGGFGTRLKPLTNDAPKPMLPVAGLPVTEHQILAAKKAGIHTLVLATSYLADVFTPYFGDGSRWGMKILYAVEKEPLGTGGAIRNAAQLLGRDEEIVIFNGDVLSRHSIANQIQFHQQHHADVTLHLIRVADARAFGCVPIDSQGRVTAFLERWSNQLLISLMLAVISSLQKLLIRYHSILLSALNVRLSHHLLQITDLSLAITNRLTGLMSVRPLRSFKDRAI